MYPSPSRVGSNLGSFGRPEGSRRNILGVSCSVIKLGFVERYGKELSWPMEMILRRSWEDGKNHEKRGRERTWKKPNRVSEWMDQNLTLQIKGYKGEFGYRKVFEKIYVKCSTLKLGEDLKIWRSEVCMFGRCFVCVCWRRGLHSGRKKKWKFSARLPSIDENKCLIGEIAGWVE